MRLGYVVDLGGLETALAYKVFDVVLRELIEQILPYRSIVVTERFRKLLVEHELDGLARIVLARRKLFFGRAAKRTVLVLDHGQQVTVILAVLDVGDIGIVVTVVTVSRHVVGSVFVDGRRSLRRIVGELIFARKVLNAARYQRRSVDGAIGVSGVARETVFHLLFRYGVDVELQALAVQRKLVSRRVSHRRGFVRVVHKLEHIIARFRFVTAELVFVCVVSIV